MSKSWDTSSIEAMERTAKGQEDGCCSKKIGEHWLEVQYKEGKFKYMWGKNYVNREDAVEVLRLLS